MKTIRRSSLLERDDLELWIISLTIAIVAYLYRVIPIFFIITQRCILYEDSLVLSSPSLLGIFFGIFVALFIWNLVVLMDCVWQKKFGTARLVIHVIYTLILLAGISSVLLFFKFAHSYDAIMKSSNAEWNATERSSFSMSNTCRESKKYVGRWEVSTVESSGDLVDFSLKELVLEKSLEFKAYDRDSQAVFSGHWRPMDGYARDDGEYSGWLYLDDYDKDFFVEFLVVEYTEERMILQGEFLYFDSVQEGELVNRLDRLSTIEEPQQMLGIDWSFILDRNKFRGER